MLARRIFTAAVLVPLLVAVTLYGKGWPFFLLAGAAAAGCALEYFRMFFVRGRDRAAGVAVTALTFAACAGLPAAVAAAAGSLCAAFAAWTFLPGESPAGEKVRCASLFVLGAVYVGGFLAAWPRAIRLPRGEHWVLLGIAAVAAGDTAAYFTGRAAGRRKLAPAVSPNKTVEGAAGGLAASVAAAVAYAALALPGLPAWYAAAAGAVVGAAGQAGDLFESLLKRAAGVKDSGTLLPGHGGLFDRADGVIAAGPALFLFAALSPFSGGLP